MSNASLKEQLQTLGLSDEVEVVREKKSPPQSQSQPRPQPTNKKKLPEKNVKKQKPAWLEQAQYGVELLKAHFPDCFKEAKDIRPLKVGIKQDLVKYLSTCENIVISDKACMVSSLAYYVNSPSYHKQIIVGADRIDLLGHSAGLVTAEEANYSAECRKAKLQKKQTSQPNNKVNTEQETSK